MATIYIQSSIKIKATKIFFKKEDIGGLRLHGAANQNAFPQGGTTAEIFGRPGLRALSK